MINTGKYKAARAAHEVELGGGKSRISANGSVRSLSGRFRQSPSRRHGWPPNSFVQGVMAYLKWFSSAMSVSSPATLREFTALTTLKNETVGRADKPCAIVERVARAFRELRTRAIDERSPQPL
jgi:hypothetical protein